MSVKRVGMSKSSEVVIRAVAAVIAGSITVGSLLYAQSLGVDSLTLARISAGMGAVPAIMSIFFIFRNKEDV